MTTSAADFSKGKVTIVDWRLPVCDHVHSQSPCAAVRSITGGQCYGCLKHCQDPNNFSSSDKNYRFTTKSQPTPTNLDTYDAVTSLRMKYGTLDPENGLGARDRVTIELEDFPDDDSGTDPYYEQRPWDPRERSMFFRKLYVRNQYFAGRTIYIRTGYLEDDGTIDVDAMAVERYFVTEFYESGHGKWRLVAQDLFATIKQRQVPEPTTVALAAQLAAAAVTGTLSGDYADLPAANFWIAIDEETIKVGTRVGATIGSLTRAQFGSTDVTHDADTRCQKCWVQELVSVETWWGALQTEADIAAGLIDTAGAATEAAYLHSDLKLTSCIREPTDANALMRALNRQVNALTYWDSRAEKNKFKAMRPVHPSETKAEITDTMIEGNGLVPKENIDRRYTRVIVYFGVVNWSKSIKKFNRDKPNFSRVEAYIDLDHESSDRYDDQRTLEIFAWGIPATYANWAAAMAWRKLNRHLDSPRRVTVRLEEREASSIFAADAFDLTSPEFIDEHGEEAVAEVLVIGRAPTRDGSIVTVFEVEETKYDDKWWIWAPADIETGDYTAAQKALYAKWALATGKLPDGSDGYRWV